jgi:CRISPR-associated endonuclease/helicase Cas3
MCAQHRHDKLNEIRQRLKDKEPCRLVSTQLIEAGVDIDFPAVYRAPAGFDTIAQAAGRCNREGLLSHNGRSVLGRVYLFETERPPPPGLLRAAAQCAAELYGRHNDPLTLNAVEEYFRLFYWTQQHRWDNEDVLGALADRLECPELQLKFRVAALRYKIIREEQTPILVPYNREASNIRSRMMRGEPMDYRLLRAAQRYLVSVREAWLTKLAGNSVVTQHESGLWWLANEQAYSAEKGLSLEAVGFDPEMLTV